MAQSRADQCREYAELAKQGANEKPWAAGHYKTVEKYWSDRAKSADRDDK